MERTSLLHPGDIKSFPMKKQMQIAVPKPCAEKWSSFNKTPNGGFCSSCQEEVIDFTSWSDERIKSYFKNLKGDTCGRFRQDQLKVYSYEEPSRTRISLISFVFAGFLLLFSSRQVSAQTSPKNTTEQYHPKKNNETAKARLTAGQAQRRKEGSYLRPVIGVVKDVEQGVPLSGVMVTLKGTSKTTTTDVDGKFTLDLPNNDSSQVIVFSLRGFKTVEYLHNVTRPGQEIAVDMRRDKLDNVAEVLVGVLGGAVVSRSWYEPREIAKDMWWWLTGR